MTEENRCSHFFWLQLHVCSFIKWVWYMQHVNCVQALFYADQLLSRAAPSTQEAFMKEMHQTQVPKTSPPLGPITSKQLIPTVHWMLLCDFVVCFDSHFLTGRYNSMQMFRLLWGVKKGLWEHSVCVESTETESWIMHVPHMMGQGGETEESKSQHSAMALLLQIPDSRGLIHFQVKQLWPHQPYKTFYLQVWITSGLREAGSHNLNQLHFLQSLPTQSPSCHPFLLHTAGDFCPGFSSLQWLDAHV